MVQLMSPAMAELEGKCRKRVVVKLETEDSPESQIGTLRKRPKLDSFSQVWNSGNGSLPITPPTYDPLDEPSPLGLRLRKSPSLLELIQMKLSQSNGDKQTALGKKSQRASAISSAMDKLKASNFPASVLQIGTWEYKSRYEGDLVAKCYFAKHKLVWEVLDGTLKNKIEIQWSDIEALKANYPDDGPGTLDVVLARQPLFFREINPQPRKHTLWQATSDFTGGQASQYRRHFVQCPPGFLRKHYEKLIQCDPRLNFLSHQPDIVLENPYFEPGIMIKDDQNELCHEFDVKRDDGPAFLGLQDTVSSGVQSSSRNDVSQETHSPNQEIESSGAESSKLVINWDQLKVPGRHPSMSISDLVSHIGNCLTEKVSSDNFILPEKEQHSKDIMEEITQYLFNDSQLSSTSNEHALMKKVNSLCCLLQKDSYTSQNLCANIDNSCNGRDKIDVNDSTSTLAHESKVSQGFPASKGDNNGVENDKQAQVMSRKDSFGELLLTLPRIASLPQFLFNLSQDCDNQTR